MKYITSRVHALHYYAILAVVLAITPHLAHAETCSFSGNLDIGSVGEDVRCLQKYLNENGYIVSDSGPGSRGNETNLFQAKTKEAVRKWQQAMSIYPATGTFGPLSRSGYQNISQATAVSPAVVTTTSSGATTEIPVISSPVTSSPNSSSSSLQESSLKNLLKAASDAIKESEDTIDDAEDDEDIDSDEATDMRETLEKAKDKLFDAVIAYIDGDLSEATTLAERAQRYADDAVEDITDEQDKEDADEAIQDAKDAISDARKDILDAEDDDEDTDEARELYDDARRKLDDAREAYDDEDYDKAIDLAEDAQELAEESSDSL